MMTIEDREAIAREELAERFREERQAENDRLGEERDARLQAEANAKDKQRRDAEGEQLVETLRRNFHAGNPAATAQDFDRLLPKLRDDWMLEQAKRDPLDGEVAAQRAAMPAGFSGTF